MVKVRICAPINLLFLKDTALNAPADTDNDGDIDGLYCAVFATNIVQEWGANSGSPAELNGDGIVNQ